ncbi:MAG TPA: fatty acid desaturase [Streptosporangiaceae bacterium]
MKDNPRQMTTTAGIVHRDYGLIGPGNEAAVQAGLANAEWYRPPIDEERLQQLMQRQDLRPAFDTALWFSLIAGTGVLAWISLGSWWAIPAFALFGALWGGANDARWHEHGHGTAFRSRRANDLVYNLSSFMMLREPTLWRWSHFRHHSDTQIVGRDSQVSVPRPPSLLAVALNYFQLINGPKMLWLMVQHAVGKMDKGYTQVLVPREQFRRVAWEARVFVVLLLAVIGAAVATGSIVPLLFVGLPSFYGAWLLWFFAITQHAGLREDVLDHRLSARTVYINPVFRFLYLNMNYHVEHHMFPGVPYYNLPRLHEEIKGYLPPPKTSMFEAYREILHALLAQRRDPTWELPRDWQPADITSATATSSARAARRALVGNRAGKNVDLGPADVLRPGQMIGVQIDGQPYVLCRQSGGKYSLADGLCTHFQAALTDGHFDGCRIECPRHNGQFDVETGEPVRLPARVPLRMYAVTVVGERLIADVPVPSDLVARAPAS